MKANCLLLALCLFLGLSNGFQEGLVYKYHYSGRVATGVPEIRSQVAGVAIKFDVAVKMFSGEEALIQFSDIKVGEHNGHMKCDMRSPLPVIYRPIGSKGDLLSAPFRAYLHQHIDHVMEVPAEDESWITNIRKSVVNQLRVQEVIDMMPLDNTQTFYHQALEDTLLGTCLSHYTFSALPNHSNIEKEIKQNIKSDVQMRGKKSVSGPNLGYHMWSVVRTIDLDDCVDEVYQKKQSLAYVSGALTGHGGNFQSRSSRGEYILQGSPGSFRMVKAISEETILLNPFAMDTQKLQTITNQTLDLYQVQLARDVPMPSDSPMKVINTWKFEVISPFGPSSEDRKSWVNYTSQGEDATLSPVNSLTGIKISDSQQQLLVSQAIENINKAADQLTGVPRNPSQQYNPIDSSSGEALTRLQQAAQIITTLNMEQIHLVYESAVKSSGQDDMRQLLFFDALSSSGSRDAIRFILQKIQSGAVSSARATSIFISLPNNIQDPAALEDIFNYLKRIDSAMIEKHPYLVSAALVNTATMFRRLCVDPMLKNSTIPAAILGDHECSPNFLHDVVLPFYKSLFGSNQKSWVNAVVAQSIGNLGMRETFKILEPVILSYKGKDQERVRTSAIFALAARYMPHKMRNKVMGLMRQVAESQKESSRVRQCAIAVMISWHPSLSWWKSLATSTWREPSTDVVAFISSTIINMAKMNKFRNVEQIRFAQSAMPLMKQLVPAYWHSYNSMVSHYLNSLQVETTAEQVNLKMAGVPRETYLALQVTWADLYFSIFEFATRNDGMIVEAWPKTPLAAKIKPVTRGSRKPISLQDHFKTVLEQTFGFRRTMIYMRFFNNMQHFIPIDLEIQELNPINIVRSALSGKPQVDITFAKYALPLDCYGFVPSSAGLPVVMKAAMPMVFSAEGHADAQSLIPGAILEAKANIRIAYKMISMSEIYVPWSMRRAVAGVDSEKSINLPLNMEFGTTHIKNGILVYSKAKSLFNEEFPVVHAHNFPFTALKPLLPVRNLKMESKDVNWKIIYMAGKHPINTFNQSYNSESTGLASKLSWDGDLQMPYNLSTVYEAIRYPDQILPVLLGSPDARMWTTTLQFQPDQSRTKDIKLAMMFLSDIKGSLDDSQQPKTREEWEKESEKRIFVKDLGPINEKSSKQLEEMIQENYSRLTTINVIRIAPTFESPQLDMAYDLAVIFGSAASQDRSERSIHHARFLVMKASTDSQGRNMRYFGHEGTFVNMFPEIETPKDMLYITDKYFKEDFFMTCHMEEKQEYVGSFGVRGTASISEERLLRLKKELLAEECDSPYSRNRPLGAFRTEATYDKSDIVFFMMKGDIPDFLFNATQIADSVITASLFPYVSHHLATNRPREIFVRAIKPLSTERWVADVKQPYRQSRLANMQMPMWVDGIFYASGIPQTMPWPHQ